MTSTTNNNRTREPTDRLEKIILKYIQNCTQHVRQKAENRILLVKAEMEEYKALQVFEQLATPLQWSTHLIFKSKMKLYGTKSKNYLAATKRVEYDLPPKFISNIDYTFKIDEFIFSKDEAQALYNQMRHITKEYRIQAMSLYVQSTNREREIFTDEIKHIIEGPRFIYNDPKTASRRRATELAILKRKIELRFFEKKVSPGRSVELFIAELNVILQKLHDTSTTSTHRQKKQQHKLILSDNPLATTQSSQSQNINSSSSSFRNEKKKNYGRLVKRLKHKIRSASVVLQKTDKSKVFHLGTRQHYQKKSNEYMEKTEAYQCLGVNDPLPNLIERTNKYLLDLRLAHWITQKQYELLCVKPTHWITQKQYELLCVKPSEAKLAHLYYLPKTHKPGTSLHPIVSGLKHPNIKISTYLNQLLRPLFDKIALKTTATSRFEVMKQVYEWSTNNLRKEILLCTIDVVDLYTMIPQTEGVLAIKKMLDYLGLKQTGGLKIETIIRLSRFVMKNNYFL
ncbi:unnamed protein product [Rotaria magnacalcarata]|uniref:Reverse transcriptase domain-containing protein n=1 Tax=Rotaria magnacalcarata TaxID=392030 RepID=A0A815NY21_9BILA|nr:unnamed protein product [Rotaria magnacalcarata]